MITNIKRYQYLKAKCQPLSFYGCLSERLVDKNLCQIKGVTCLPLSIPATSLPLCPYNTSSKECARYQDLHSFIEECLEILPCITEEYSISEDKDWSGSTKEILRGYFNNVSIVEDIADRQMDKYIVWLYFRKWSSSNGLYTGRVKKEIHREYLVWTDISMIGNVGGQLGLWVGFSFTGFLFGALSVFPKVWTILKCYTS